MGESSSVFIRKKFVSRCSWNLSYVCVYVCVRGGGGGGGGVEVRHSKQTNFAALLSLAPCGELPFSFGLEGDFKIPSPKKTFTEQS